MQATLPRLKDLVDGDKTNALIEGDKTNDQIDVDIYY